MTLFDRFVHRHRGTEVVVWRVNEDESAFSS